MVETLASTADEFQAPKCSTEPSSVPSDDVKGPMVSVLPVHVPITTNFIFRLMVARIIGRVKVGFDIVPVKELREVLPVCSALAVCS
jgi:hypothetical protein